MLWKIGGYYVTEKLKEKNDDSSSPTSEADLREELYEEFDVSRKGRLMIRYLLPILDKQINTESRYDVDPQSKILAEISLYQAYEEEPKFKIFAWAALLIGTYDLLHPLNPAFYGLLFAALATLNGFVSSLRSPSMMTAELEGATDTDGMPADYRAKAHSSVNTNVTLVLFVIAVGIQLLVTSSVIQGEIITQNVAVELLPPAVSALGLSSVPFLLYRLRGSADSN